MEAFADVREAEGDGDNFRNLDTWEIGLREYREELKVISEQPIYETAS